MNNWLFSFLNYIYVCVCGYAHLGVGPHGGQCPWILLELGGGAKGSWTLSLGLHQEQYVLLTDEPALQSLTSILRGS